MLLLKQYTCDRSSSSLSAKRDGWEVSKKQYSKLLQGSFSVGLVCAFFVPFSKWTLFALSRAMVIPWNNLEHVETLSI